MSQPDHDPVASGDLLERAVVGRHAPLAAAVIVAGGTSLLIGLLQALALIGKDLDPAGAFAFGLSTASVGLVFTGVSEEPVLSIARNFSAPVRVRNANGDTVPLGSFTTVNDIAGPYRVPRYNLYPAAEIDGVIETVSTGGFFGELSLAEIAETTGRPLNTVKTHVSRLLQRTCMK